MFEKLVDQMNDLRRKHGNLLVAMTPHGEADTEMQFGFKGDEGIWFSDDIWLVSERITYIEEQVGNILIFLTNVFEPEYRGRLASVTLDTSRVPELSRKQIILYEWEQICQDPMP